MRGIARLQHRPDLPEIQGKGADGLGVARAVAWVPLRRVGRRCHQSAVDGTEALDNALVTQCPREVGHSGLPTGGGGPGHKLEGASITSMNRGRWFSGVTRTSTRMLARPASIINEKFRAGSREIG